jgi:hypothetical protein
MTIGTAATITIEPEGFSGVKIGIEVSRSLNHPEYTQALPPFRVSKAALTEATDRLKQELEIIRRSFGSGVPGGSPADAGRILEKLHRAGTNAASSLFGDSEVIRLQSILQAALSRASLDSPLLLELKHGRNYGFPIELVPITRPTLASAPSSKAELQAFAESFPVFSCIVRRTVLDAPQSLSQESELYGAPELTAVFFWDESAPGSTEDLNYFLERKRERRVRLEGPIPGEKFVLSEDPEKGLALQLLHPPTFTDPSESGGDIPFQLVHIAAHSQSNLPGIIAPTVLLLGNKVLISRHWWAKGQIEKKTYRIGSGDLEYFSQAIEPMSRGPIGVLSSCYSTFSAEQGLLGLVVPLLRAGYRCVVGFDTAISGPVANKLFTYTYDLLLQGMTLGEALNRAQVWLLLEQYNPLGMLMRSYGRTDLSYRR